MKKNLHKDPLVVALGLTMLALMILPHRYWVRAVKDWANSTTIPGYNAFEYRFVSGTDLTDFHWPTFVVEMALIWGGFFLYKHITKPDENE
jgi:hypothetical protein